MHPSRTIFLVANEPWGDVWYSKQHYAHELARLGHQVYYVHPPSAWRPTDLFSFSARLEVVDAGVKLVHLKNNLPVRFLPKLFQRVNDRLNSWKLGRLSRAHGSVLWWQFDPLRYVTVPDIPGMQRIYHVVDPYHSVSMDAQVASRSDLVVTVNETHAQAYEELGVRCVVIPHGIAPDEVLLEERILEAYRVEWGVGFVLFVGTVNVDVDLVLLADLADSLPQQQLLFVGPVFAERKIEFEALLQRSNVRWAGLRHASTLKYFVSLASVCLVPYTVVDIARWRTPLKVMNYLAQGKHVVSTVLLNIDRELPYHVVRDHGAFLAQVRTLLDDPRPVNEARVAQFVSEHAYPKLVQRILLELQ